MLLFLSGKIKSGTSEPEEVSVIKLHVSKFVDIGASQYCLLVQ